MPPPQTLLSCRGVIKGWGGTVALDGFDLELKEGSLLALLGPSGCGKTTALRIMAGLERPSAGEVWIGERLVAGKGKWVRPEERRIGMVFQDWALFPHLDVFNNVAFGCPGRDRARRVGEVLELVHLTGFEGRMPHELSGGQQQRVALARALAPSPEVVLLDEPFSNLDASLRAQVRAEVRTVLNEARATAIFVTHDQEEALSIADSLAVMTHGRVIQTGSPHAVYGAPAHRLVAGMVGEANFLPGEVRSGLAATPVGRVLAPGLSDGPVDIMIRPEAIHLDRAQEGGATIVDAEFYGHDQLVRARLRDGTLLDVRLLGPRPDLMIGARVDVRLTAPVHFFRADSAVAISPYCGIVTSDSPQAPVTSDSPQAPIP